MKIVEYKLDPQDKPRSFHPKTLPSFVTDGGYWIHPDGSEVMIGMVKVGLEGSIPNTATIFNLEGLQTRQREIHANYPMRKTIEHDSDILTDDEVNAVVKAWVDERS